MNERAYKIKNIYFFAIKSMKVFFTLFACNFISVFSVFLKDVIQE